MFIISPILFFSFSLLLWSIIPYYYIDGYYIDFSYSILFQLFLSSLTLFALIIAGWASHSKYSFIGSLRSGAQMLS